MVYGGKWNGTVKGAAMKGGIVNQGTGKDTPPQCKQRKAQFKCRTLP